MASTTNIALEKKESVSVNLENGNVNFFSKAGQEKREETTHVDLREKIGIVLRRGDGASQCFENKRKRRWEKKERDDSILIFCIFNRSTTILYMETKKQLHHAPIRKPDKTITFKL